MPYPYNPFDPGLAGMLQQMPPPGQQVGPGVLGPGQGGPPLGVPPGFVPTPPDQGAYDPALEQQRQMAIQAVARNALMGALQGNTSDPYSPGAPGAPIPQAYLDRARQMKQMTEPGPMESRFLEANANVPENVHGIKARLAGIGKGLLMGGLGGAVYGGIDPSMVNRAWYRSQLPALAQAAQVEGQIRHAQLARAKEMEGLTGIDPLTGLRGPSMESRDYMNALAYGRLGQGQQRIDIAKDRADTYAELTNERIKKLQGTDPVTRKRLIKDEYNAGMFTTPEQLDYAARELGIPGQLAPKFRAGMIKVDDDYNFVDLGTGQKVLNQETGAPITSVQKKSDEIKKSEGAANRATRVSEGAKNRAVSQQRLSDAEEKDIDKQARLNVRAPLFPSSDPDKRKKQQDDFNSALEAEKSKLRAEKQQQRGGAGGGASVKDPNVGRVAKRQLPNGDWESGNVVGIGADGQYIIDWPSTRQKRK